jgi:twinkle protein
MSVIHTACPWCGSRDNLSVWDNGSQKCFTPGCNFQVFSDPSSLPTMTSTKSTGQEIDPIVGEYVDIPTRGIKAKTNQQAGYIKGKHGGEPAYFAPIYSNERVLTGYKIRKQGKNFLMHGTNPDNRFLFQEKWGGNNKLLVIFEGEYDALSYIQVRDWPAVSLPNGCESGNKVVRAQLSWLLTFETVIFCYDDDDHGRKAALRDVQLLPPRVGKIGTISGYKDANEALQAGDSKAIVSMVYQAKEYEPDGIVNGDTLLTPVLEDPKVDSIDYSFPCLNENILGARKGEMVVWCAGTGSGKSTAIGEQIYKFCVEQGTESLCL